MKMVLEVWLGDGGHMGLVPDMRNLENFGGGH